MWALFKICETSTSSSFLHCQINLIVLLEAEIAPVELITPFRKLTAILSSQLSGGKYVSSSKEYPWGKLQYGLAMFRFKFPFSHIFPKLNCHVSALQNLFWYINNFRSTWTSWKFQAFLRV